MTRYAVVGASIAGVNAAEAIRDRDADAQVHLIDRDASDPYDRPALSKQYLVGDTAFEDIMLRQPSHFRERGITLRLGVEVEELDASQPALRIGSSWERFDAVVVATGCRARMLPGTEGFSNVHAIRTEPNATHMRQALVPGARMLAVGAGFIGLEIASVARAAGVEVTVVEPEAIPLGRVIGDAAGSWIRDVHVAHGVRFLQGTVQAWHGDDRVTAATLSDGQRVELDFVVVGVGVIPNTDWLVGSGVEVDNGVVCDEFLMTSAPRVLAAGDVARWQNPAYGQQMRIEHFDTARRQGLMAGRNASALVLGLPLEPAAEIPYVWSDQYDMKIQIVGRTDGGPAPRLSEPEPGRLLVEYPRADGAVAGVLAVNMPAHIMRERKRFERLEPNPAS